MEFQVRDSQGSGSSPNPDMQGYAIRLSSFIIHLGVAMLMAWSNKSHRHFYSIILAQMTLIIFGTLVRSNYLNIADAKFAIIQTHSPVCVYIFLFAIPRLFLQDKIWKEKKKKKKNRGTHVPYPSTPPSAGSGSLTGSPNLTHPKTVLSSALQHFRSLLPSNPKLCRDRIVAFLVIAVCLVLNLVQQFDKTMFSGTATKGFLADSLPAPGKRQICVWIALALYSAGTYELVLHRHSFDRRNIMHQLVGNRKILFKSFPWHMRILWGFCATWFTVMKLHPWLPCLYAVVMFINWSLEMNIWRVEENYTFNYGQLVSISPAIFIVYRCLELCTNRSREIASLPCRFALDVIWLISGKGRPWTKPEFELVLKDPWDMLPTDLSPEAIELPITRHSNIAQQSHRQSSKGNVKLTSRATKENDIGESRPPYSKYIR